MRQKKIYSVKRDQLQKRGPTFPLYQGARGSFLTDNVVRGAASLGNIPRTMAGRHL